MPRTSTIGHLPRSADAAIGLYPPNNRSNNTSAVSSIAPSSSSSKSNNSNNKNHTKTKKPNAMQRAGNFFKKKMGTKKHTANTSPARSVTESISTTSNHSTTNNNNGNGNGQSLNQNQNQRGLGAGLITAQVTAVVTKPTNTSASNSHQSNAGSNSTNMVPPPPSSSNNNSINKPKEEPKKQKPKVAASTSSAVASTTEPSASSMFRAPPPPQVIPAPKSGRGSPRESAEQAKMRMFGAPRRPTRRGSAAADTSTTTESTVNSSSVAAAGGTTSTSSTSKSKSRRQKQNAALQARLARENAKIAQMNNCASPPSSASFNASSTSSNQNKKPHKISPVPLSPRRTRSTEDLAAAIPPSPPIRQESNEQGDADAKMPAGTKKDPNGNDEDDLDYTTNHPPMILEEEDVDEEESKEEEEEVATVDAAAAASPGAKMIQVSPGVSMRLRDANETKEAIKNDNFTPCLCWACQESIFCIADASYVVCPVCQSIGPMMDTGDGGWGSFDLVDGGVGLGFTIEDLEVMQWDCINESFAP